MASLAPELGPQALGPARDPAVDQPGRDKMSEPASKRHRAATASSKSVKKFPTSPARAMASVRVQQRSAPLPPRARAPVPSA